MTDRVALSRLCVRAGDRTLVHQAALRLAAGEIVGLVGSSGSGKTLTARSLVGLVDLRPGIVDADLEIRADGQTWRPWALPPSARARLFRRLRGDVLTYLPQDARAALDPLRRVGSQVAAAAALAGDRSDPRDWLALAGLQDPDRVARLRPHELSGGMAQRVVIAQALARRSRFLLADEPTTGLDPTVQVGILAQLRELATRGAGILLITHDLRLLPGLAHRVVLMESGHTVEELDPHALIAGRATSEPGQRLLRATQRVAGGTLGGSRLDLPNKQTDERVAWAIDGLTKRYRGGGLLGRGPSHLGVDGVSLRVGVGERVAIIGESGSGKTSLVRAGLGLVPRDAGRITILGRELEGTGQDVRRQVQLLVQDPRAMLHPDIPIGLLLRESALLHRPHNDPHAEVAGVLEQVGLSGREDALPDELSGGERRRAGLARVLLARPRLLVADEPTAGLDAALKASLIELLVERAGPECAVVLVSHDLPTVAWACDRVWVMHQGRIVDTLSGEDLRGGGDVARHHPQTRALLAAAGLVEA